MASWSRELKVAPGDTVDQALGRRTRLLRDPRGPGGGRAAKAAPLAELGRGDFFGELAALDWGAGYGYARLATVTAIDPLRLLVLAPAHLARLMAEVPAVEDIVRSAVRERLPAAAG